MQLNELVAASKTNNQFTIISDDSTSVLLFEGKTVMAGQHEDFHSGHDTAYFDGKEIKKSWKSPLELHHRIIQQFKIKEIKLVEHNTDEDLFLFLEKNNMYACDDSFC